MIYPVTMRFSSDGRTSDDVAVVAVVIDREGWRFDEPGDELVFRAMPVNERLKMRHDIGEQVRLAKNTPTKGEHR